MDTTTGSAVLDGLVQVGATLPFNQHMGVEVVEVGEGTARTRMRGDARHANHLGGVHAVAELAPAELAGALAASSRLVPLIERGYVPVVAGLEVRYRAPAAGDLEARASVPADVVTPALATADAGDRPRLDVDVEVTDSAGTVVAQVLLRFTYLAVDANGAS